MKNIFLFLLTLGLMICLVGCNTSRPTSALPTENSAKTDDKGPVILFVTGTIGFDSIANAYYIQIKKQEKFPGQINIGRVEDIKEPKGLNYKQLDDKDQLLSCHEMDNPLILRIEYPYGEGFKMKTVIRKETDLFLRIQLNPRTKKLRFCDNQDIIETIIVKQ